MQIHGYTESGSIDATIDGVRMTVPDDMANRHRQMVAEWEADGNTIPPYVPPPGPSPLDLPLTKRQVIGALIEAGDLFGRPELYDAEAMIDAAIEQISDLKKRAQARNDWRNVLTNYQRDHDLFNDPDLLAAMDITPAQVDQLWQLGTTLPS